MSQTRAQLFSTDMIIAITIFLIVLLSIFWLGEAIRMKIMGSEKTSSIALISSSVMSALIETTGDPPGWNQLSPDDFTVHNISSLGLADNKQGPWILDPGKIEALTINNYTRYDTTKTILGLRKAGFEYLLYIASKDRQYLIGLLPEDNATYIKTTRRIAYLNGSYANLTLYLWEKCGVGCS